MPLQTAFDTALTRADARSDDRRRKIAFAARLVPGRQAVAWHGRAGRNPAQIELLHRDPDLSVPLLEAADPRLIASEWCAWANSLSLPRLFENFPADCAPGESPVAAPRRRGSAVAKRRTRF